MTTPIQDEQAPRPVPLAAVMARLHDNTYQRNEAEYQLQYANIKIRESKEGHVATLGRLFKYEGQPIIDEALEYASTAGMFITCDSKYVGVKTRVGDYTTKAGKVFKAHFTIYNSFLEKCKNPDEEPKDYKGHFLYKTYAEQLEKYRNHSVQSFITLEDLFNFKDE